MGPEPSAAFPPSRGLSPLSPSPGAVLGLRRVLEGVQGRRVAEPGRAGGGQLAAGERAWEEGATPRALGAGWRGGRCPAPTEQATVWFCDASTLYRAVPECFAPAFGDVSCRETNGSAVHPRLHLFFFLPACC